jgi:hypothetical protein
MKLRHIAPTLFVFAAFSCSKEQPAPGSPEGYEPQPADAPQDTDPVPQPPPGDPEPSGPAGQAPSPTPMQKQGPDERLQHGGTGGMGAVGGTGGMRDGIGGMGGTKSPIRKP